MMPPSPLLRAGGISLGLMVPTATPSGELLPAEAMLRMATIAEDGGFAALWTRDVPLIQPDYPDRGPFLDPFVWLGALAARTSRIALGTAGAVLPLRHPLHVAKAAASLQALSGGRLLLGLASGDRPPEYAAFGVDRGDRAALFRNGFASIRAALDTARAPDGALLTPAVQPPPLLAVGSGGQTVQWLAANADGWLSYARDLASQRDIVGLWRRYVAKRGDGDPKPFAQALNIDLQDDPAAPSTAAEFGLRLGRHALTRHILDLQSIGVDHLMLNPARGRRPAAEVVEELAAELVPLFAA
ncbi:TIGR03571 family LLM class oxidoreductase [Plastoroseomonas hellenica]|uniref:TIGR03571 family LLM class oxidoreductase n=1 Tax=Plastoroseomonas hellenica TaxID=2687306 RepID=UPI001BA87CDD|nr:TIGR03571 family LLM class oxidoreductase [Plastoroseomonas hellenica]MBR0643106.1 TIGR03571 family LLM class oxidoreductase [Plastoroseomonas hellenica]